MLDALLEFQATNYLSVAEQKQFLIDFFMALYAKFSIDILGSMSCHF